MAKQDGRKSSRAALTGLRRRGVASVQAGERPGDVARVMGVTRQAVRNRLSLYRAGGWDALAARRRGGRPRKLDARAMQRVCQTVAMKAPRQLKFTFALWTAGMPARAIARKFGITLSRTSVGRLLRQMGLTPQRPVWRAYRQDAAAVKTRLQETCPRIRALAKRLKAEVFFGDEADVRPDRHAGTTWAVKGKTPVVSGTGARFGLNPVSAIGPRGELRFMVVDGRAGAPQFVAFLKRLLPGHTRPVFPIVDGHPAHKARSVARFADGAKGRLRLFFLPPCSPEPDPGEHVRNDLETNPGRRSPAAPDLLKSAAIGRLRHLGKQPAKVRRFFDAPATCHAA
jgi:transposase